MNGHTNVVLVDGRQQQHKDDASEEIRCITKRFGNCELREFIITAWDSAGYNNDVTNGANQQEPVI
eukprot:CAMPEP_0201707594 /NCGR_PEP_ID=MMETSP0578-20130828/52434_1 /ASSEMBLY_ACC=CAM_ASM_000663 /TAXON_ID=267565 /ORGANISM="Skeletonema grethea, Strain CCMP 1804" /LENGTH=65 /DNA_ID=CAMNT_0048196245 /DNA_START=113 /DNA_END=307 /DNA_ORIENTATION=-